MKRLLNLGVSDPLTLGMAHPVADRIEMLGRGRPTTWRTRCLALSAMSVIAFASAPLSIASDETDQDTNAHETSNYTFISKRDGRTGESYEIKTEDGVQKAYRILDGGVREEVDLTKKRDGAYQLTYSDGQVADLPNIAESVIKGLADPSMITDFQANQIEGNDFKGKISFKIDPTLPDLDLPMVSDDSAVEGFSGTIIQIRMMDGGDVDIPPDAEYLNQFPQKIRDIIVSQSGSSHINIVEEDPAIAAPGWSSETSDVVELDDTVVNRRFEVFQSSDPLETAQNQLDRTKRQLEALSDNESVSFDLQNALRDIERAQKSLEEAESRLTEQAK